MAYRRAVALMLGIDMNVLVRFIVRHEERQFARAQRAAGSRRCLKCERHRGANTGETYSRFERASPTPARPQDF